jgi:hypothetical protein
MTDIAGGGQQASAPAAPPPPPEEDSRLSRFEAKLAKSPFDASLWNSYLTECLSRSDPDIIRPAYERLLKQFPSSVKKLGILLIKFRDFC